MTDDEYRELMRFHIMLSDDGVDISNYKYAAVDSDGLLCLYATKPFPSKTFNQGEWDSLDDYYEYYSIELPEPPNWKEAIIEL